MSNLVQIEPEYIYVTIPAEYICVYHRILAMLADYGEEMLKDCKASCTDRNSGVIECFNMFNAAVAARKLGKEKLAETLIKYIKAKINQIYGGKDNSTSFVFPVDENGQLKAFVSCGERPLFQINPDDGDLYEHKLNNGFEEHFYLGEEDEADDTLVEESGLVLTISPRWEIINDKCYPCSDVNVKYNGNDVTSLAEIDYYFDDEEYITYKDVEEVTKGVHVFTIVARYNSLVDVKTSQLTYEGDKV